MATRVRHILSMLFMTTLALSAVGSAAAAPNADGPNLLQNPGFEAPFAKQCCENGLPIGEVQVAWGWSGWWLAPGDAQHPSAGGNPSWHRPEWREAACGPVCANRVRSGSDAQKYFTFASVHDAGMLQQVSGITPGTLLRFSVYLQAWSTNSDYGLSDHGQTMGMRVGIDPFGGTDAFSPNVVWTSPVDTFDAWGLYSIQTTAQSSAVTVFTRSTPLFGNQHNDIYVDDASLVAVAAGSSGGNTGQPSPVPPTVAPPPAPAPTDVPTTVPGFTYVVARGDNYYNIALRFGVSLSLLYEVNHVVNPRILFVGTVLLIPSSNPPPDDTGGQVNNPPPPAAEPTQEPTAVPGFTYIVQRGDNYFDISLRFGVSLAQLYLANHITDPGVLFVGTVLIIPSSNPPPDNTGGQLNNPPPPALEPTATTSPSGLPGAFAYTVQPGDNLFRIGLRFGVSVARIKELNGLFGDVIFVGQTLIIAP